MLVEHAIFLLIPRHRLSNSVGDAEIYYRRYIRGH